MIFIISSNAIAALEDTFLFSNETSNPLRISVRKRTDPFSDAKSICILEVFGNKPNTIAGDRGTDGTGGGIELWYSKTPMDMMLDRSQGGPKSSQYRVQPFGSRMVQYRIDEYAPVTLYDVNYRNLAGVSENFIGQHYLPMTDELLNQLKVGKSIYIDIPNLTQGRFKLLGASKAVSIYRECISKIRP